MHLDPTATVGRNTVIGEGAWIGPSVVIGERCVIGPGAVIGTDGFGYTYDEFEGWVAKSHDFTVRICDNVHVGANTCIDRGSWRDTYICSGARIDNLVHVAHNVRIGWRAVVIAHAEISGSVIVEERAWIGPRACVRERLTVGARALVGIGAVVIENVPPDVTVAGVPARIINSEAGVT